MTKQEAQEIINRLNSNRNIEMPLCLLKSACETIVKQEEWQDISTAPKDGTVLLLGKFLRSTIGSVRIWVHEGYFLGSWKYDWNVKGWNVEPTHWMPLPAAPKEKE